VLWCFLAQLNADLLTGHEGAAMVLSGGHVQPAPYVTQHHIHHGLCPVLLLLLLRSASLPLATAGAPSRSARRQWWR
jgi:hypothetical protein